VKVSLTVLLRDAWRLWRQDRELLIAIAGPFVFLPWLALLLLLPDRPQLPPGVDAGSDQWQQIQALWLVQNAPWILAAELATLYGQFTIVGLYASDARAAVGTALLSALRRLPMLLLALFVVALPTVLVGALFTVVPPLISGFLIALVIVYARAILIMPVLQAGAATGPFAAVGRSFRATRGQTLMLAATVMTIFLTAEIVQWPFTALDKWMAGVRNPVAEILINSAQAAVSTIGAIAMALVSVSAYRRLSSR